MGDDLKAAIGGLREQVAAGAANSEVVFSAETRWISGVTCEAKIRDFPPLPVDEPPLLGGKDSGANPVELLLAALGTCQEIMYAAMAALMDIPLNKVEVNARGYLDLKGLLALDDNIPAGYTEIKFETRLESPASKEQIAQLIKMVEDHCPVMDTLVRSISVKGKQWLNGEKLKL
ncbi:MAG: OsmC family protein [Deltaproteobacteria bacterium]|nr:OsmC family protein [Deltaproteobacteria bacterium]